MTSASFAFVFHPRCEYFCQNDPSSCGPIIEEGRLEKHQWLFRDFVAHLRGGARRNYAQCKTIFEGSTGASSRASARREERAPAGPRSPRRAGDLDDIFHLSISPYRGEAASGVEAFAASHTGKFSLSLTRVVVGMRLMCFTRSPRSRQQSNRSVVSIIYHDGAQHEKPGNVLSRLLSP